VKTLLNGSADENAINAQPKRGSGLWAPLVMIRFLLDMEVLTISRKMLLKLDATRLVVTNRDEGEIVATRLV